MLRFISWANWGTVAGFLGVALMCVFALSRFFVSLRLANPGCSVTVFGGFLFLIYHLFQFVYFVRPGGPVNYLIRPSETSQPILLKPNEEGCNLGCQKKVQTTPPPPPAPLQLACPFKKAGPNMMMFGWTHDQIQHLWLNPFTGFSQPKEHQAAFLANL